MKSKVFAILIFLSFLSCKKDDIHFLPKSIENAQELVRQLKFDRNFINKLNELYDQSRNNNYETGYILTTTKNNRNGNRFNYRFIKGSELTSAIVLDLNSPIDGLMHCHYKNLYPLFSCSDIKAVYDIYTNGFMGNYKRFISLVVSSEGPAYILSINSIDSFRIFSDNYLASIVSFRKLENDYANTQQKYNASYDKITSFELSFFEVIASRSSLSVFKSLPPYEVWNKIEISTTDNKLSTPL